MRANQPNIDHWNSEPNRRWVTEQPRLDRVFDQLDDVALKYSAPQFAERVVDIGCGCGSSALRCADLVGPSGWVLGIDVSRMMLERARDRASAYRNITLVEADAADYAFAGDADYLYSRLGTMFFADPEVAFANLRRALRAGGRLCMICWRTPEENPWYTVPLRAASAIVEIPKPAVGSVGPFALANADRLRGLLESAGFEDVALHACDVGLTTSTDGVEEAVQFAMVAGPLARVMFESQARAELVPRVRSAVRDALVSHVDRERVALGAAFWIVTAHG
jgi:ubiquinone/menaquinone biosynthesis C-methylase UbiE